MRAKASEYGKPLAEKGIVLESAVSPALVEGVPGALDRALTNLLDNSIAASGTGIANRIGAGVVGEWAWMAVSDQGPGLPEEPEGGRIGLELSIVEQIAEGHEGTLVSATGPDGVGTTMTIWIPKGDLNRFPTGFHAIYRCLISRVRFGLSGGFLHDDKRGNDTTFRPTDNRPSPVSDENPTLPGSVATEAPFTRRFLILRSRLRFFPPGADPAGQDRLRPHVAVVMAFLALLLVVGSSAATYLVTTIDNDDDRRPRRPSPGPMSKWPPLM